LDQSTRPLLHLPSVTSSKQSSPLQLIVKTSQRHFPWYIVSLLLSNPNLLDRDIACKLLTYTRATLLANVKLCFSIQFQVFQVWYYSRSIDRSSIKRFGRIQSTPFACSGEGNFAWNSTWPWNGIGRCCSRWHIIKWPNLMGFLRMNSPWHESRPFHRLCDLRSAACPALQCRLSSCKISFSTSYQT